jgi:hypothetical protein
MVRRCRCQNLTQVCPSKPVALVAIDFSQPMANRIDGKIRLFAEFLSVMRIN